MPTSPTFYLTRPQPIRPGAILLATVAAIVALSSVVYALGHNGRNLANAGSPGSAHPAPNSASAGNKDDEDDDPNQVDTIALGDPSDAPVPARRGDHVSPVHPTILVHLPRFGEETGLIPDSPAGHLLYTWLAAFNKANAEALGAALPTAAPVSAAAAQMELRQATGGFALLSSREAQPGVLVFRLRDQTTGTEALGTLQMLPGSNPATVASFSLRGVPTRVKIPTTPAN